MCRNIAEWACKSFEQGDQGVNDKPDRRLAELYESCASGMKYVVLRQRWATGSRSMRQLHELEDQPYVSTLVMRQ